MAEQQEKSVTAFTVDAIIIIRRVESAMWHVLR